MSGHPLPSQQPVKLLNLVVATERSGPWRPTDAPISAPPSFAGTSPPQQQPVHLIRARLVGRLLLPSLLAVTQPLQP